MIFHQIPSGGCQSYLIGCPETCVGILVDPEISQIARYEALAAQEGLRLQYLMDTHTHADHFSATQRLSQHWGVPVIMHQNSPAPFVDMRVDDGEMLRVGHLRLKIMHTPGHTADSVSVILDDRILTGDALLMGAAGRTDLPTGNPDELYDSLFNGLLRLDPKMKVFPAHDYKGKGHSTLEEERAKNPRLQKKTRNEFVEHMQSLNLSMPTHLTEALRTNQSGGKTVVQLLEEAAQKVPFMSIENLLHHTEHVPETIILDVREREAFEKGHLKNAISIPRGQLELCVNERFPDPTKRMVVCCESGQISILAAATLRDLGFGHAVALEGGLALWREKDFPLLQGNPE